ncbi:MAG: hypothetical protein KDK90_26630 [Leptospiraceae bacterium]|nr:hypothetical protein [Leptospiraceae bacterium]
MRKIIIITMMLIFTQCKYTGGYDIVKGSEAMSQIKKKILSYSSVGTLFSANASFTCPSTSNATTVTDTESNDTFSQAQKFDFLSSTQSTIVQGTITTGDSDYDVFYTIVPSDSTYTTLYYKAQKGGNAGCDVYVSTDGATELSNNSLYSKSSGTKYISTTSSDTTQSTSIASGNYIFLLCLSSDNNASYHIELSLTSIGSTSSTTSSSSLSSIFSSPGYLLSYVPSVFDVSSGIDKNKYYTQASVDDCLKKLQVTVPAAQLLDRYNLNLYISCGAATYQNVNPYFVAGWQCNLQEAGWIQIGDLGL